MATTVTTPFRIKRTLDAATLTSGTEQVIDFALPLFAGAALGLSALQTGLLIAATQAAAFLIRPWAGVVVDRHDRAGVAVAGAVGMAVGCGLYALATGFWVALGASLVVGLAGAFCGVAIRAIIGERLPINSRAFAELLEAEETGGWLVLVPAIFVLSIFGYTWVFVGIAACCLVAAVDLLRARGGKAAVAEDSAAGALVARGLGDLGLRLRPMLMAVVITMAAEAAIALLLMMHLQRGFGLDPMGVAMVFLPGAIAMSVLPKVLHRLVLRFGRTRMLMVGSLLSAAFALGLAFAPTPNAIAALWVLSAVAWSLLMPIQQSVIAEAAGQQHLGRGLSLYEAACLLGAFAGSLVAGVLYEVGGWQPACLASGAIIALGAGLVPRAVRQLPVSDRPREDPKPSAPTGILRSKPPGPTRSPYTLSSPISSFLKQKERTIMTIHNNRYEPTVHTTPTPETTREKTTATELRKLAAHAALLGLVTIVLALTVPEFSLSGMAGVGENTPNLFGAIDGLRSGEGSIIAVLLGAMRIWYIVFIIDVIWTAVSIPNKR